MPGTTADERELLGIAEKEDGVESVSSLAGYEILSEGTSANSGSCLINLKSWKEEVGVVSSVMGIRPMGRRP